MKRITLTQKLIGATRSWSAGYLKTTTVLLPLMLFFMGAIPGTAGTIYVVNSSSTIGEYDAAADLPLTSTATPLAEP